MVVASSKVQKMAVAERIRELASDKGLNIKDFSAFLGVSERTIQNYLAGISLPNGRFLVDLAEKIGASPTWVLVGDGPKYVGGDHQNMRPPLAALIDPEFVSVPRYAVEASAGHGAITDCEDISGYYAFNRKWLARRSLNPDSLCVISVRGDSMEPRLRDGDLILVDRAQSQIADGLAYVVRLGDDLMVKNVQRVDPTRVALLSVNKLYPPREIDIASLGSAAEVIGRVVASMHEW